MQKWYFLIVYFVSDGWAKVISNKQPGSCLGSVGFLPSGAKAFSRLSMKGNTLLRLWGIALPEWSASHPKRKPKSLDGSPGTASLPPYNMNSFLPWMWCKVVRRQSNNWGRLAGKRIVCMQHTTLPILKIAGYNYRQSVKSQNVGSCSVGEDPKFNPWTLQVVLGKNGSLTPWRAATSQCEGETLIRLSRRHLPWLVQWRQSKKLFAAPLEDPAAPLRLNSFSADAGFPC